MLVECDVSKQYCIFQGKWSDNAGRRFVLIVCLVFAAFSYFALGMASTILLLFLSRVPAGNCFGPRNTLICSNTKLQMQCCNSIAHIILVFFVAILV